MILQYDIVKRVADLPKDWDLFTDTYFQSKTFLEHTENYNPCDQRYYLAYYKNCLKAAAVVYTLPLDLFTFLNIKSPINMKIMGIPCSVSCPGIFGDDFSKAQLIDYFFQQEKGLRLILNQYFPSSNVEEHVVGETLPTIVFENQYASWDDYINSLRTHYRRRLKLAIRPIDSIRIDKSECAEFSEEMYQQYLQVYRKSKAKLEKLSYTFFKDLPDIFQLNVCTKGDQMLGWTISLMDRQTYYFFMGGVDYSLNKLYSTYLRLLAKIVQEGIEKSVNRIDLGQTAEIPKTRFGGICHKRYLEAGHSSFVMNKFINAIEGHLVYKRKIPNTHVFKLNYENLIGTTG